jgi:hypothetical protein
VLINYTPQSSTTRANPSRQQQGSTPTNSNHSSSHPTLPSQGENTNDLPRISMQVPLDPTLLFLEPLLCLLQVFGHAVGGDERLGLGFIVRPRALDEGLLEVLLVNIEILTVGIGDVETERDWGWTSEGENRKRSFSLEPLIGLERKKEGVAYLENR